MVLNVVGAVMMGLGFEDEEEDMIGLFSGFRGVRKTFRVPLAGDFFFIKKVLKIRWWLQL